MRQRIFWSALGIAAVALVLTGLVVALIGQRIVSDQTREDMRRDADAAELILREELAGTPRANVTITSSSEGSTDGGADLRRRLVGLMSTARRLLDVDFFDLAVVGPDGQVQLVASDAELPFAFDGTVLTSGEEQFVSFTTERGIRGLAYARPVAVGQADDTTATGSGRLALVLARERPVFDLRVVLRVMGIVLVGAIALAAAASRIVSRRLTSDLDKLSAAAEALAAGDLTVRADASEHPELAGVTATFNDTVERLAQAQERERTFLMSVGHELRTPLTTIAGYAEMLEGGDLTTAETERVAVVLNAESSRLRRLVEDVMLLARLEAREFTLTFAPLDVGERLAELTATFQDRAARAGVRLVADIGSADMVTDGDRIDQIVANLLENALRYTPEAGEARIVVRPESLDQHRQAPQEVAGAEPRDSAGGVRIRVSDSGSGIDPEDLPRVFDKFYVARVYRRLRPEGSGLGLSIVKELVDALTGTVAVETSGSGTTITVWIPSMLQADSERQGPGVPYAHDQ